MRLVAAAGLVVAASSCGRLRFDARGRGLGGDGGPTVADDSAARDGAGVDAAAVAPSCAGLASTCGPGGATSCCESLPVPGGTFARGYDVSGDGMYPDSSQTATVSAFHLDTYEVTVGRFRRFVAAGMGTQAHPPAQGAGAHVRIANSGWDPTWNASLTADTAALTAALKCDPTYATWTDAPAGNEHRPINCVTWYEAMAFCAWDGGYLPTEAEWNDAAAGGDQQRPYPWSSPPSSLAIDCSHLDYTPSNACVAAGTSDVGRDSPAGDGRWGQADLAGNVFEWNLDWDAAYTTPCTDCADLTPSAMRVVRGGDFGDPAVNERTAYRGIDGAPGNRDSGVGIRCARP